LTQTTTLISQTIYQQINADLSNIFIQKVDTVVELIFLFTFPKQRKPTTSYN